MTFMRAPWHDDITARLFGPAAENRQTMYKEAKSGKRKTENYKYEL